MLARCAVLNVGASFSILTFSEKPSDCSFFPHQCCCFRLHHLNRAIALRPFITQLILDRW